MPNAYSETTLIKLMADLREIVCLAQKPSQEDLQLGPPCSYLFEVILNIGLEGAARQILDIGEFRLNGAGLKLIYDDLEEKVFISKSDQYNYYPEIGPAIDRVLSSEM